MNKPNQNIAELVKQARRVSAPLLAINTADQTATIADVLAGFKTAIPAVEWDCVRGMRGVNKQGAEALSAAGITGAEIFQPIEMAMNALKLPGKTAEQPSGAMLFIRNAGRFLGDVGFIQGIANLRDEFKADRRTAILLSPDIKLPPELVNDVMTFDEPLPDESAIEVIGERVHKDADCKFSNSGKVVDAATGLSAFLAEQTIAMSLKADGSGVDIENLWDRKCQAIEQTPGLRVWRGQERFANIGGYGNIKEFLSRYLKGKRAPRVIVYIDEIEKAFAGLAGDTSGVSQDQAGALLSFMQDERCAGTMLYGPAGTGKSNLAKASGNEAGTPVVAMDLGALKGSHVGESEGMVRAALKTVKAMGQDRIFFVATCNSLTVLPPELRRRFKCGTFFVDLPNEAERKAIWDIYLKRYGIAPIKKGGSLYALPDGNGQDWTGAEIETCCEYAENFGCTTREAAQYIVPVAKSASEVIDGLRRQANGRYLSASAPGVYKYEAEQQKTAAVNNRAFSHDEE